MGTSLREIKNIEASRFLLNAGLKVNVETKSLVLTPVTVHELLNAQLACEQVKLTVIVNSVVTVVEEEGTDITPITGSPEGDTATSDEPEDAAIEVAEPKPVYIKIKQQTATLLFTPYGSKTKQETVNKKLQISDNIWSVDGNAIIEADGFKDQTNVTITKDINNIITWVRT